jgi:Fic family protein
LKLGKRAPNARQALSLLYLRPVIAAVNLQKQLGVSQPTANSLIRDFERLGILRKVAGGERYRLYAFERYLDLFLR